MSIKKFATKTSEIIRDIYIRHNSHPPLTNGRTIGGPNSGYFYLSIEEYRRLRALAVAISESLAVQEDFPSHKVLGLLEDNIASVVLSHLYLSLDLRRKMKLVLTRLDSVIFAAPRNWQVYLPVDGLHLDVESFSLGLVTFLLRDRTLQASLRKRRHAIIQSTRDGEEAKEIHKKYINKMDQISRFKYFAEIEVSAVTPSGARAEAMRVLRQTLDILNLYALIFWPHNGVPAFAHLPGEAVRTKVSTPVFSSDGDSYSLEAAHAGPMPLRIAKEGLDRGNKWGLLQISKMLSTPESTRTTYQTRLLTALQWAGRAYTRYFASQGQRLDSLREEAFLYYAIALECLCGSRNSKSGITKRLSIRCALINSHPVYSTLEIENKREAIQKLYHLRSSVVHSGSTIVPERSLWSLERMVTNAIFICLLREPFKSFESDAEFEQWCDEQRDIHEFALRVSKFSFRHIEQSKTMVSNVLAEERKVLMQALINCLSIRISAEDNAQ